MCLPSIIAKLLILSFIIIVLTYIITFNNESNGIPNKEIWKSRTQRLLRLVSLFNVLHQDVILTPTGEDILLQRAP